VEVIMRTQTRKALVALLAIGATSLAIATAVAAPKKKAAAEPETKPAPAAAAPAPAPASAADDLSRSDPGCQKEASSLCADTTPGNDQLANCLRSVKDQLGPDCKKSLNQHLAARFPVLCKDDVQKHCASESKQGLGQAFACMKGRPVTELSDSCKRLFAPADVQVKKSGGGGAAAAPEAPREKKGNPLQGFFLPPAK
jgi:hypothetical protein